MKHEFFDTGIQKSVITRANVLVHRCERRLCRKICSEKIGALNQINKIFINNF